MELRQALDDVDDLVILYVLPGAQVNPKTRAFVEEMGLRDRVRFLVDADSATIDALGIRKEAPEPIERGVPHPATYVLDREGIVAFADVRRDFHIWIDSQIVAAAIHQLP